MRLFLVYKRYHLRKKFKILKSYMYMDQKFI
jgi:hypothetical protein